MKIHPDAMKGLEEPLSRLGLLWAQSTHRPRLSENTLSKWDVFLDAWWNSGLPVILRNSGRRDNDPITTKTGRKIYFADNTPAMWMLSMALHEDAPPDITGWSDNDVGTTVPRSFLRKAKLGKHDLNKAGWKICHIKGVKPDKRLKFETADAEVLQKHLQAQFRKFLSPRNMFLIPIEISGAGELGPIIEAIVTENRRSGIRDF